MLAIDHVQIAMPAGGEAAARGFFGELLGLTEIPKPAEMANRGGCWFGVGDLQIHLGADADFHASKKAHVALRTPALAAVRARLADAGFVICEDTPVDGRSRFFTHDPFGNRVEFISA